MPVYGILQLVAVSITAYLGLVLSRGSSDWLSVVFSVAFSHYLLAIWYGRRRFAVIVRQPAMALVLGMLLVMTFFFYKYNFPLAVYFALHHAFNETYLRNQRLPVADVQSTVVLRSAAIVLHFIAVLLLIKNPVRTHYEPVLWVILIASAAIWMQALSRHWAELDTAQRLDQVMLELLLLLLLPFSHFHPFTLLEVVCYHVVFWGFYPLIGLAKNGDIQPLIIYLSLTLVTIGGFLAISPAGIHGMKVPVTLFYSQFIIWSWLHITLAFATSSAHPQWITRWFAPRKAVSV